MGNFISDNVKKVSKSVSKTVSNVSKVATKTVSDVVPDVTISKADQSIKGIGKALAEGSQVAWDMSYGGVVKAWNVADRELFNDNLNKYSGNLLNDAEKAGNTSREAAQGKAVDDNLKAGARVGLVIASGATGGVTAAATSAMVTSGMSEGSWGNVAENIAKAFLPPGVANVVGSIVNPKQTVEYNSTYTPTSAADMFTYEGGVPTILVVGVVAVSALLLIKKMKH